MKASPRTSSPLYAQDDLEQRLRARLLLGLEGDSEAYADFLESAAEFVRGFIFKAMHAESRSEELAEELAQEVLLSIHSKRATYRPEMPVLPWIQAIARYRLIDSLRQDARRPQLVAWEEGPGPLEPFEGLDVLSGVEVDALLAELTPRQREVLVLAKLNDLPLAEIARQLRMSLSAVKVTVHRAMHSLRDKYGGSIP